MATRKIPGLSKALALGSLTLLCGIASCSKSETFKSLEETKALIANAGLAPILTRVTQPIKSLTEDSLKLDINNERSGDDTDMKYTCFFDRAIDGSINGGSPCDNLPFGPVAKFEDTTGKLTWGPFDVAGTFEISIEGSNKDGTDVVLIGVDISQNKIPKLERITDQTLAALKTLSVTSLSKRDVGTSTITYSCRFDKLVDEAMNSADSCRNLPGDPAIKFDSASGVLNWIPPESAIGSYEFEISAQNANGSDAKIFAVNVTASDAKKVTLTYVRDQSLVFGDTLSVDVNNTLTSSDDGVTYTCFYDSLADGTVNELLTCDLLPGVPAQKFNPLTGVLNWTPSIQQTTDLEIKVKGVKQGDSDAQVFVVSLASQRFGEVGNSALVFDPTSWDFGSVQLNATSTAKTVNITNSAAADVYLGSFTSTAADFVINWNACPVPPAKLASLASCLVNISFHPSTAAQLGASIVVRFGRSQAAATDYSSVLGLSGRGVGTLNFAGLSSINAITHKSMTLNWPLTTAAASYLIFEVVNTNLVYLETILNTGGTVVSKTLNNLTPNTTHTYRVRATDFVGVVDSNTVDKTATTLANQAPSVSDGPSSWQVYSGRTIAALDFNDNYIGNDSDRDGDAITYTCYYDDTIDGAVAASLPCSNLLNINGSQAAFNQYTGILSGWKPRQVDETHSFEFKVSGADSYGATSSTIFSTTIVAGSPTINAVTDRIFPTAYIASGNTFTLSFDNIRFSPYNDTDMTYTCSFKRLTMTDGSSAACSTLPGTFSLGASTGELSWLPGTAGVGAYEFVVTGTNLVSSHFRTFKVDVLSAIDDSHRLFHLDARFADGARGNSNPVTLTSTWLDLTSSASSGLLAAGFNGSSPWVGTTAASSPMALSFDGSDDAVSFASSTFTGSALHFDAWVYEGVNTKEKVIFSHGNSTENGLILTNRRMWLGNGTNTAYSTAVLASNPVFYWRLDDISSGSAYDEAPGHARPGAVTSTGGNVSNNVEDAVFNLSGAAVQTSTTGYIHPAVTYTMGANWSVEAWFFFPMVNGCSTGYCALTRGTTVTDYQVMVQQGNLNLGVYKNKTATATPANGFLSSGYSLQNLRRGWHHLVAVGTGGTTTFYIDGAAVGNPVAYQPVDDLYFVGGPATHPFGKFDEFAVYNTALSPATILNHYNAGAKSQCYFSLNDGFWYNIAGTLEDTTHAGTLFLNGSQACSFTKSSAKILAGSSSTLTLGKSSVSGTNWLGKISSLIFYDDASTTNIYDNHVATTSLYSPQVPLPPAGLRLWLRADTGLFQESTRTTAAAANNDPVLVWEDQSGTGGDMAVRAAANQTNARPTLKTNVLNGKPVVSFDGTDDNLQNLVSYGFPNTVFIVAHYNGTTPRGRILSGTGNSWALGWHGGFWDRFFANGWVYQPSPATDNSWQIYSGDHSSSVQRIFKNNNSLSSASTGTQGPVGLNLGSNLGTGEWSICEVAEVIVYDRVLSATERAAVFLYLNTRYAVYP